MRTLLAGLAVCCLLAADAAQDAAKKDSAKLEGEWTLVSAERNGEPVPDEVVKTAKRVFEGNEATVTVNDEVVLKATVTIDATKKPKTIDYKVTEGEAEGKTILGIYELDGDNAKFCSGTPGGERPTEFTAKEGSGRTLSVWKRVKK